MLCRLYIGQGSDIRSVVLSCGDTSLASSKLMRSSKAHGPWPDKTNAPCRLKYLLVVGIAHEETLHCQIADVEEDQQVGLDQSIHDLRNSIPIINRDYCHCCQHK